ncbi:hypothetical protein WISP_104725 [Willisornis vidua]|uniref:UST sulfotransferase n=1 Tax=Willisornis vidua TaxID=1566151 RepID=A0ABQ9CXI9_9PASS|nr:hypothetical protein WISP_104725 [Willisornis vidua]
MPDTNIKVTPLADQRKPVDVIFWDFGKAFDIVPHRILLDKMSNPQLDKHIMWWEIPLIWMTTDHPLKRVMSAQKGEDSSGIHFWSFSWVLPFPSQVVYNRVGKCGSRTVVLLLRILSEKHGFNLVTSDIHNKTRLTKNEQMELIKNISTAEQPYLFTRHVHFLNFSRFGGDQPVYINIIRDPVNRFLSNYFFRRFGDWRGEQNHMIRTPSMRQEERYLPNPQAEPLTHWPLRGPRPGTLMYVSLKTILNVPIPGYFTSYHISVDSIQDADSKGFPELIFCQLNIMRREKHNEGGYTERRFTSSICTIVAALHKFNLLNCTVWTPFEYLLNYLQMSSIIQPETVENQDIPSPGKAREHRKLGNLTVTVKKTVPSPEAIQILYQRMRYEYEFYYYVKEQFHLLKRKFGLKSHIRKPRPRPEFFIPSPLETEEPIDDEEEDDEKWLEDIYKRVGPEDATVPVASYKEIFPGQNESSGKRKLIGHINIHLDPGATDATLDTGHF